MLTAQSARQPSRAEKHGTILAFGRIVSIDLHEKDFPIDDEYAPFLCVTYRTDHS
ncbi:MAG: hypothetical protein ABIT23_02390 [Nitrosospira sp.]